MSDDFTRVGDLTAAYKVLAEQPTLVCPPPWRARVGDRPFLLHSSGRRETITWRDALSRIPRSPGGAGAHDLYDGLIGSDE